MKGQVVWRNVGIDARGRRKDQLLERWRAGRQLRRRPIVAGVDGAPRRLAAQMVVVVSRALAGGSSADGAAV